MIATASELRTDRDMDFAAIMAAQLQRTPWLLVSLVAHTAALLLLWLLLPAAPLRAALLAVAIELPPDAVVVETFVQPPTPTLVEPTDADPVLVDPLETAASTADTADVAASDVLASSDVAAPSAWTAAVGLGGGSGSRVRGGGPHGNRGDKREAPHETIRRALEWLSAHQDEDGHWDCDDFMKHDRGTPCDGAGNAVHDVGVTGLALLAFLGDGNTLRQGPFRDQLRRGVQWLCQQQESNGRFGAAIASDYVYDHAIAAYAMSETCGLSDYQVLRRPAEMGLAYLAAHRNPYGAWRYQPRDGDSDTSVSGWCVLALASGRSLGLQVDGGALRDAATFFDQCTSEDGRCGYTRAGEGSSRRPGNHGTRFPRERGEALTAVALFCRYFLGQRPQEQPCMDRARAVLMRSPPVWDERAGSVDHYYWYYGTYAMYQAGGAAWTTWCKHLDAAVVRTQRTDGNFRGSWNPVDVWGEDGGRVYSTAILALTLQAHYRYSRLVR